MPLFPYVFPIFCEAWAEKLIFPCVLVSFFLQGHAGMEWNEKWLSEKLTLISCIAEALCDNC